MSEATHMWLYGGFGSWLFILTCWGMYLTIGFREIRSILILTSKKAAEVLHSPDDHHGIDGLLEKYIKGEHELTWQEWGILQEKCEQICSNPNVSKDERFLAGFLSEVCKLERKNTIL